MEKGNPHTLLVGMQTGAATMENSMKISQKIKNRNTIRPGYPATGYLSKELEINNSKRLMHPYVHCSKKWNQPKCPATDDWIKKMWHMYTMEYYSAINRQNLPLCNNMDGP